MRYVDSLVTFGDTYFSYAHKLRRRFVECVVFKVPTVATPTVQKAERTEGVPSPEAPSYVEVNDSRARESTKLRAYLRTPMATLTYELISCSQQP